MKVDPLLLGTSLDVGDDEETVQFIEQFAEAFLRCGGRVTLAEFRELSPESRVALQAASARLRDEMIAVFEERLFTSITGEIEEEVAKTGDQVAEMMLPNPGKRVPVPKK